MADYKGNADLPGQKRLYAQATLAIGPLKKAALRRAPMRATSCDYMPDALALTAPSFGTQPVRD